MRHPLRKIVFLVGLLATCAGVRNDCRAAELNSAELRQRGQDVAAMSVLDRDRLQRNWQTFQEMSPERRQHFRQLHDQLDADLKTGGKKLNHTMQTYSQWLQMLNPGQREDLRQAKNPAEKLDLVRKFKDEQDHQQESRVLAGRDGPSPDPGRFWRRSSRSKPLRRDELDAALQALVDTLPSGQRAELASIDGTAPNWSRYRQILQASARQAGGPKEWPNKDQEAAVLAAIKATEQGAKIKASTQELTRRDQFGLLFFSSFAAEMFAEMAPDQPQPGDLEKMYEQVDNTTREELLQLPLHEMNHELRRRYYKAQLESRPELQERQRVHREFQEFTRQFLTEADIGGGFGRPGGPFRGGRPRGPDGDGPPPDRGPGDRGPPPDRGGPGDRPRPPR